MKQHPMVKAYIKAFANNGGKEFKTRFNPFQLQQTLVFGYRRFEFRIISVGSVPSWDEKLIPAGVSSRNDVVMIQSPNFGDWLECDAEAQVEYTRFMEIVGKTFAVYE